MDNVTVQLHFVRLAFSIAGDARKSTRAQPACWRFLAAGFFSKVVMQEKISFYPLTNEDLQQMDSL